MGPARMREDLCEEITDGANSRQQLASNVVVCPDDESSYKHDHQPGATITSQQVPR